MEFKKISKFLTFTIIGIIVLFLVLMFIIRILPNGSKKCTIDEDCFSYGESGTCSCGCYSKKPWYNPQTKCWCAVPENCACVDNICQPVP